MNSENRRISNTTIISLGVLALFLALAVLMVASYASAKTYGSSTEANLRASQEDSRNVFAQAGQKIREVAQVPEMYASDVERVTRAAIEGRYGENGSQATFQWLQEQNPNLDASIYAKVQQVIESSRRDFENAQRRQIDIRRQYEASLGSFWRGAWLSVAGFPKEDLSKFDIVSTVDADRAFSTKQEEGPIKLR